MLEMMHTAIAYGSEKRDYAQVTYVALSPRDEMTFVDGCDVSVTSSLRSFSNPNFKFHWGL